MSYFMWSSQHLLVMPGSDIVRNLNSMGIEMLRLGYRPKIS